MIIVSNTGLLIALAKLDRLSLLNDLASEVYVPPQVRVEALAKAGPETYLLAAALTGKIQVREPAGLDPTTKAVLKVLDEGERQAIALARTFASGALLVLDDRAGRAGARQVGQPFVGLAGLLLLSKERGLLSEVVPLLEVVREKGYWISDEIIATVGKLAAE